MRNWHSAIREGLPNWHRFRRRCREKSWRYKRYETAAILNHQQLSEVIYLSIAAAKEQTEVHCTGHRLDRNRTCAAHSGPRRYLRGLRLDLRDYPERYGLLT